MAGILPTGLPTTATTLDPDLFITQRDGDVIVSSITKANLEAALNLVKTESVILHVGANGDYTNVKDAMDSITDSSGSKPYTILVTPGVYEENNPIVSKAFVSVFGIGSTGAVRLNATNAGNLFTGSVLIAFTNVTFGNVTSGYAVEMATLGGISIDGCVIGDCENGIHVNHVSSAVVITNSTSIGINTGNLFEVTSGQLTLSGLTVTDQTTVGTIVKGVGGRVMVNGVDSFGSNVTTGFDMFNTVATLRGINLENSTDGIVINGGSSHTTISGVEIHDCTNDGLRIGTGNVDVNALHISNSAQYNVNITGAAIVLGNIITILDNTNISPSATVIGLGISDKEGDSGVVVYGEFSVGTPLVGGETVLGHGDSYTNGMFVYSFDGTTYTDISTAAQSPSGSAFNFANPNVNTAFYITSDYRNGDYLTHPGMKINVMSPIVLGGGEIVYEYWDGGTWVEFNYMVTDSGGKYLPHAKQLFEASGSYQVRFDINMTDNWVKNDPITSGIDRFWTRIRIKTAITTSPSLEQFKLHTAGRTEINSDGYIETFGLARSISRFPWDAGLLEAAAASPSNQDLFLSDNLDVGRVENKFVNNNIDRVGFLSPIPETIDTSTPIVFAWSVITDDATAGNIEWVVSWGFNTPTGNVYKSQGSAPTTAPNEQNTTVVEAAPISANTVQWYKTDLDISDMISRRLGGFPDTLWVSLERVGDSGSDTHSGDIALVGIAADFLTWCFGGHF